MVDGTVRRNDLESLKQELSKSAPIYHNLDLRQLTISPKAIKYILPYSREHFVSLHKNELGNKGFQDLENFLESQVNAFDSTPIFSIYYGSTVPRFYASYCFSVIFTFRFSSIILYPSHLLRKLQRRQRCSVFLILCNDVLHANHEDKIL